MLLAGNTAAINRPSGVHAVNTGAPRRAESKAHSIWPDFASLTVQRSCSGKGALANVTIWPGVGKAKYHLASATMAAARAGRGHGRDRRFESP